ncbi:hypothetical protein OHU45_07700 [Streptomyces tubercidicus]|nr:hypothetical protein OG761_07490 [Streptomyces tubercidicus]WSX23594.1 hypothetical protein OG690_29795 [Streptomyces tubercidicus]
MAGQSDEELFDLIGAIGAGTNAARDESLSDDERSLAQDLTNDLADRLGD